MDCLVHISKPDMIKYYNYINEKQINNLVQLTQFLPVVNFWHKTFQLDGQTASEKF